MKVIQQLAVLTLAFGISGSALADMKLSKDAYFNAKSQAEMEFNNAIQKCESLSGNAKEICVTQAKGDQSVAKANADAEYKGTDKARFEASKAKVDAAYDLALQRCNDFSGTQKNVCRQEATAAKSRGTEDAKVARTQAESNHELMTTQEKARQEAGQADADADYNVAIEKCDQFSGANKDQCITSAKSRFGK